MIIFLILLNIILSITNFMVGIEGDLFNIWVSGFNAAGAFGVFLIWLMDRD